MATPATDGKIVVNFGWVGPSRWQGGQSHGGSDVSVVDLTFKNAKTDICVDIPANLSSNLVKKLPFTCRRFREIECKFSGRIVKTDPQETHPDALKLSIEQIRNLTIKAGIFKESPHTGPAVMDQSGKVTREKRVHRSDREIKLEVPEKLEIGQTYSLVVTSNDFSFSARLIKEEKVSKSEFLHRTQKMGEALITEGVKNLNLLLNGGGGVFNSSTTPADVLAHGMQGVIRSGQHMHPDIKVPSTKPSESSSDLNGLSIDELQSRFEATYKKDKELESQRTRAALAGNVQEMNQVLKIEHANSQWLMMLAEAIEKKGGHAQIPQSESFLSAANESAAAHAEALELLKEAFKTE